MVVSMSRGGEGSQRILLEKFTQDPTTPLDTAELCKLVYHVEIVEKRHRVAIIRALKRLAETRALSLARRVLEREKSSDLWFSADGISILPSTSASATRPRPNRRR